MSICRYASLLVWPLLAACDRSSPKSVAATTPGLPQAASTAPSATAIASPNSTASSSTASSGCPRTGSWALCNVEIRLTQAGFVVRRAPGQRQRRAGFTVLPAAYILGRSRLEVFVYPDAASLERDMSKIDTLSAAPPGAASAWGTTPALVRSGNLAAVFLSDSPVQVERLTLALTAGAPQPGSSR